MLFMFTSAILAAVLLTYVPNRPNVESSWENKNSVSIYCTDKSNDILGHLKFGISCAIYHQNRVLKGRNILISLHASRRSCSSSIPALCLLLSGDIHPHPGPNRRRTPPKYPCGICAKNVTWNSHATQCDCCDIWFHARCVNMGNETYQHLCNNSVSWTCFKCGLPNFASSFFSSTSASNWSDSNIFSVLDTTTPPVINGTPNRPSRNATSTPVASRLRRNTPPPRPLFGLDPISPIVNHTTPHRDTIETSSEDSNLSQTTEARPPLKSIDQLRILVINFQSLNNKQEALVNEIRALEPDIILGTETHLDDNRVDTEIFPASTPPELKYNLLRRDRNIHGGGVIILSRPGLLCTREVDLIRNKL